MQAVLKLYLSFAGIFTVVLGIAQLLKPRRSYPELYLFLTYLSAGLIIFYAYLSDAGVYFGYQPFNYLLISAILLGGPACYLFFRATFVEDFRPQKRDVVPFLPAIAVFLALPVIEAINADLFPPRSANQIVSTTFDWTVMLMTAGFLYATIFSILIYRSSSNLFVFKNIKQERAGQHFILVFTTVGLLNLGTLSSIAVGSLTGLHICAALFATMILVVFLFSNRYPTWYDDLRGAIVRARYKKSLLDGVDVVQLHMDILRLMYDEKLYLEESLTMQDAANELNIRPHILSEFLNKHLTVNFAQFVNNFRIHEAKKMLLEDDEVDVLSIGYSVGFRSKTTFHVSFKEITGMSPREFIKSQKDND